jgi:hypothetical protein
MKTLFGENQTTILLLAFGSLFVGSAAGLTMHDARLSSWLLAIGLPTGLLCVWLPRFMIDVNRANWAVQDQQYWRLVRKAVSDRELVIDLLRHLQHEAEGLQTIFHEEDVRQAELRNLEELNEEQRQKKLALEAKSKQAKEAFWNLHEQVQEMIDVITKPHKVSIKVGKTVEYCSTMDPEHFIGSAVLDLLP